MTAGALERPSIETPPLRLPDSVLGAVRAYVNLGKPHVTSLLLAVTATTMIVADRTIPSAGLLVATLVGGALAAASANAFNCYIDRDIDGLMGRTRLRAVPAGKVTPVQALLFGAASGVLSMGVFLVFVNALSGALALGGLVFYVLVYTLWLKRSTPQNIVIGGAAGAVPVLVGWAAATGNLAWPAVALFAIIFFWTPPHFWALSLLIKRDYERAGIPMLPNVKGEAETRRQILIYTFVLIAITLIPVAGRALGAIYLASAVLLAAPLLWLAVHLWRSQVAAASARWANRLFWYSNSYLALLFAAMAVDRLVG